MWKHDILESLKSQRRVLPKVLDPFGKRQFEGILVGVEKAVAFYFGEQEETLRPTLKKLDGTPAAMPLKMPFNVSLFEYSWRASISTSRCGWDQLKSTKRTILVCTSEDVQAVYSIYYINEEKMWEICPMTVVATREKNWAAGFVKVFPNVEKLYDENRTYTFSQEAYDEMCMLKVMSDILNCQNVVTKTVNPPERLNKKRIRNGKIPFYSYKILEVVKGKPKSKDAGEVPWGYESPESVRFHLCRGHFKTFTEDRPLFGKYSGTFWWNPQSRGDRNKGVIEKEYKIIQA